MIHGGHVVIYSKDADADKAFFRDILKFPYIDVHDGWLIFKLPPSELAVHPSDANDRHEFFLMTDNLPDELAALKQAGATFDEPSLQAWGLLARIQLPGGGRLGLYQPRHARP